MVYNGSKPYEQMDDLGVKPPIFGLTPIWIYKKKQSIPRNGSPTNSSDVSVPRSNSPVPAGWTLRRETPLNFERDVVFQKSGAINE